MSESKSPRILDARGLACPEPVVRTKKALEEGGFERLDVLVDNLAARENVLRFASYSGCSVSGVEEKDGVFTLHLGVAQGSASKGAAGVNLEAAAARAACAGDASPEGAAGATVFIPSDRVGRGDDELGALLMRGFLYALAEAEAQPKRIIFMNSGVKLAVEGSESLDNLRRLAASGVEILACGTCLDFFKVKDKLAVGRVSNMYEIAGFLLEGRCVSM
jgi:selenium metabolism protein YedF